MSGVVDGHATITPGDGELAGREAEAAAGVALEPVDELPARRRPASRRSGPGATVVGAPAAPGDEQGKGHQHDPRSPGTHAAHSQGPYSLPPSTERHALEYTPNGPRGLEQFVTNTGPRPRETRRDGGRPAQVGDQLVGDRAVGRREHEVQARAGRCCG